MRVLVTGADGQLGHDLIDAFDGHDVVAATFQDFDVAEEPAVWDAVGSVAPDLFVHAAGWTDVDGCERDPDRAHRVNALGSWWVARACASAGAAMVLVSSDYVFGGGSPRGGRTPYHEFDPLAPVNAYGRSKAAAERLVRDTLDRHYIVRTSWMSGARGNNFVRTMLTVARERGEVAVVDDQVGSPTFTRDLAAAIRELAVSGRFGTYHRTNGGECSWFELAATVFELAGLDVELRRQSSQELDHPARRPTYSVLSNRHAELCGLMTMPHWRDGLARMLEELDGHDPDQNGGDRG